MARSRHGMGSRVERFISGVFVFQSKTVLAALAAVSVVGLASAAQASTVYNTSLIDPPGVFFGTGNFNTHYAVTTADGVQIGVKSKIRGDADDTTVPVGNVYSIAQGNKVSFDFAVIPGSVDLSGVKALITLHNVGTNVTTSFDPTLLPDNSMSGGAYENSEQLAFFPVGFSTTKDDTYDVTLSLTGVPGARGTLSVEDVIKVGAGAVPEPASWALMILGFGGVGAAVRRSKRTLASATA